MRDCANCFHRKPVLKEDGTWTAECEKWDCEFQSRENMIEKTKAMNNDLISRSALKEEIVNSDYLSSDEKSLFLSLIDNAPTVEAFTEEDMAGAYNEGYACGSRESEKPKGEWVFRSGVTCGGYFKCNKCGEVERAEKNFCPNCGADMRGEDK